MQPQNVVGKDSLDQVTTLEQLKEKVRKFAKDRDWEQFHSPKNLSMALSVEAAELMELFQWANTVDEAHATLQKKRKEVEEELADIAVFLLEFCSLHGIDLTAAIETKLKKNAEKYPVEKSLGSPKKYTEL